MKFCKSKKVKCFGAKKLVAVELQQAFIIPKPLSLYYGSYKKSTNKTAHTFRLNPKPYTIKSFSANCRFNNCCFNRISFVYPSVHACRIVFDILETCFF